MPISRRNFFRRLGAAGLGLGFTAMFGCSGGGDTRGRYASQRRWSFDLGRPGSGAKPPVVAEQPVARGMVIRPRSAWTAREPVLARVNPMNGVRRITVHHAGFPNGYSHTREADVVDSLRNIQASHMDNNGWGDIGYHYMIDPNGRIWEGREARYQGAHVNNNNPNNLGIMLLGNFDLQRPTTDQAGSLEWLIADMQARYDVAPRNVFTHQELSPSGCPGRHLQQHMINFRDRQARQ